MLRRTFNFRGLGDAAPSPGLGATWVDLLVAPPTQTGVTKAPATGYSVAPPERKAQVVGTSLDVDVSYITNPPIILDADQAKIAADQAARDAAEAKAEFNRVRTARNMGGRGETVTPQNLVNAKAEADAAQARADQAQAQLETLSPAARIGSAIKWAAVPVGAGVILTMFGYKKVGVGALVVGAGLGVFRFFKSPSIDASLDAEET